MIFLVLNVEEQLLASTTMPFESTTPSNSTQDAVMLSLAASINSNAVLLIVWLMISSVIQSFM